VTQWCTGSPTTAGDQCHVAAAYGASDGAYPAAHPTARTVMIVALAAFVTFITGVALPLLT
jgi:hypothetical protein